MKIGKTVKVVTSPKRNIKKASREKSPTPTPVKIPEKAPVTAEWKYVYHRIGIFRDNNNSAYYNVTS